MALLRGIYILKKKKLSKLNSKEKKKIPITNEQKDMKRYSTKEDIQMAHKHRKGFQHH